jgi:hypothetical protein
MDPRNLTMQDAAAICCHKPVNCADYYGCQGCPAIETCEAFAETDECEVGE